MFIIEVILGGGVVRECILLRGVSNVFVIPQALTCTDVPNKAVSECIFNINTLQ